MAAILKKSTSTCNSPVSSSTPYILPSARTWCG
jgi:hypothetical protein